MSRRDTIIIAVLVNAALLMILFATAMHSDTPKKDLVVRSKGHQGELVEATALVKPKPTVHEDILNQLVSSVPTQMEVGKECIFTFEESELITPPSAPIAVTRPPATTNHLPLVEESKATAPNHDPAYVNITVKKGDYLEKIAKANNTTVAAIMKVNQMSSSQLKVGQVLKIPLVSEKGEVKKVVPPSGGTSFEGEYYIVKEGDNPWLIANRNRIHLEELLRLNGLDDQKAKRLRPGDKLRIR